MIVMRRPWKFYDVDLMGVGGVAVAVGVVCWLVFWPGRIAVEDYGQYSRQRSDANGALREAMLAIEDAEVDLETLRALVEEQREQVPTAQAVSALLQEMTDVARETDLALLVVAPQPTTSEGPHLASDIQVTGRGTSLQFIRFLDRFAALNPYQSLRSCSIVRRAVELDPDGREGGETVCELTWVVRLNLLPGPSPLARGGVRP